MFHQVRFCAGIAIVTAVQVLTSCALMKGSDEVGIMVPAYWTTQVDNWDNLTWAASKVPVAAIVSVASGPGIERDDVRAARWDNLRNAGGTALGYIRTLTFDAVPQRRPIEEVYADIDRWNSLYDIDGIYFDQPSRNPNTAEMDYFQSAYNYAKSINSQWTVFNNANGRNVTKQGMLYRDPQGWTADGVEIYEGVGGNGSGYRSEVGDSPAWVYNYDRSRFAAILYETDADQMQPNLDSAVSKKIGWVYLTDKQGVDGIVYHDLPLYWTAEVNAVAKVNNPSALTYHAYKADKEFSTSVNPNGVWTYGRYASSRTPNSFNRLGTSMKMPGTNNAIDAWVVGPTWNSPAVTHNGTIDVRTVYNTTWWSDALVLYTSETSEAAVRWTATEDGIVDLIATFQCVNTNPDNNYGYNLVFFNDNPTPLYELLQTDYDARSFSITMNVSAGDHFDFVLGGNGPTKATQLDASVWFAPVPEPNTIVMTSIGLLCLLVYGWRRRKYDGFQES